MNAEAVLKRLSRVRGRSVALVAGLSPEDMQIQSVPYASPLKWHLAHTTWFFETFVLRPHAGSPTLAPEVWGHLFNSYYEGAGSRHPRALRGALSRPTVAEVLAWRESVDAQLLTLLTRGAPPAVWALIELGIAHEEQHQELMLTDVLANFSASPLGPAWQCTEPSPVTGPPSCDWTAFEGGLVWLGADGPGFVFDNEGPTHRYWLEPFELRQSLVTNAELVGFIEAGGYSDARLWLSDGIAWVRKHGITAPKYWRREAGGWTTMTLYGRRPVEPDAPVCHISAYEADAVATWLGARLPTEQEWEHAAVLVGGDWGDARWQGSGPTRPEHTAAPGAGGLHGLWGEVWEWTRSSYLPYPGYRQFDGAVGEYNGKFMSGQSVLRGGSCATPPQHVRPSYRNFFYPHERWQFAGLRVAR